MCRWVLVISFGIDGQTAQGHLDQSAPMTGFMEVIQPAGGRLGSIALIHGVGR